MAVTDLKVNYQGAGATLYATISRISDYYIWNGSAFEAWAAGNIATYGVALADKGNDTYAVAFPSAIVAGDYFIDYYEQAGGTEAITDLRLTGERVHWDGTALSDVSTVTLSAYALTTLAGVKRHMNISATTYDTKLTELINFVSAQIETICGRKFVARNYRHRHDGKCQERLVLRARPVQHITRITYGSANAMTLTYTGSSVRASASVYRNPESPDAGGVRLNTVNSSGVATSNNLTFADYPSVSLMVAAIGGISGWSATTLIDMPAADLQPSGGQNALNSTVTFTYPDQDADSYTVNQDSGIVQFDNLSSYPWPDEDRSRRFWKQHQGVLVEYRAGYETVPGDVELITREMVKEVFGLSTENTAVKSSSLGPYSVSFNDKQTEKVKTSLSAYMDFASLIGGAA